MKSLKAELRSFSEALGGDEASRIARRAAEVRALFRVAVEAVYKQDAPFVLSHVNEVYVVDGAKVEVKRFDRPRYGKRQGGRILIVYCDDSTVRAALDNYQEFVKLKFREQGEEIDAMDLVPSIGEMKRRHPFSQAPGNASTATVHPIPLTAQEQSEADAVAENVEDDLTRKAFLKAMVARRSLEKGEKRQN